MRFVDYREACLRTASDTPTFGLGAFHIIHGAVGLVDELGELLDNPGSRDELGDCWWYVALLSEGLGHDITVRTHGYMSGDHRSMVELCSKDAHRILGMAKKIYFHRHSIETHSQDLCTLLVRCATRLASIDSDLGKTWEANLAKLRDRYPNAFDTARSERRYE